MVNIKERQKKKTTEKAHIFLIANLTQNLMIQCQLPFVTPCLDLLYVKLRLSNYIMWNYDWSATTAWSDSHFDQAFKTANPSAFDEDFVTYLSQHRSLCQGFERVKQTILVWASYCMCILNQTDEKRLESAQNVSDTCSTVLHLCLVQRDR